MHTLSTPDMPLSCAIRTLQLSECMCDLEIRCSSKVETHHNCTDVEHALPPELR